MVSVNSYNRSELPKKYYIEFYVEGVGDFNAPPYNRIITAYSKKQAVKILKMILMKEYKVEFNRIMVNHVELVK